MQALGLDDLQVGAVCITRWCRAVQALAASGIQVAVVSTGFPAAPTADGDQAARIELSVAAGIKGWSTS